MSRYQASMEDFNQVLNPMPKPMPSGGVPVTSVLNDSEDDPFGINRLDGGSVIPQPDQLFDDVVPGEFPSIKEDINLITEAQTSLENLHILLDDIYRNGGISTEIAMEAQRVVEHFQIPLNRFTKHPSRTQLQPSLEAITDTIWSAAVRTYKYVRNAIMRVLHWILGKVWKDESPHVSKTDTPDNIEEIPDTLIQEVNAKLESIASNLRASKNVLHDIQFNITKFEQNLAQAGIEYRDANNNTEWYRDLSKYVKDMNWNNGNQTEQKIMEFLTNGDRIHNDLGSNGSYLALINETEKLMEETARLSSEMIKKGEEVIRNPSNFQEEGRAVDQIHPLVEQSTALADRAHQIEQEAMDREFTRASTGVKKLSELMVPYDKLDDVAAVGFIRSETLVKQLQQYNTSSKTAKSLYETSEQEKADADRMQILRRQASFLNAVNKENILVVRVISTFYRVVMEMARSARNYSNMTSYIIKNIVDKGIPGKGEKSIEMLKKLRESANILRQDLTSYAIQMGQIMNV